MILTYIAGYEKLKPYGPIVHCGIDGGSNFVVYCVLALNKKAETIFMGYKDAVDAYGRPLRLRADMCFEAVPVGQDMIDHHGPEAYIPGPSTANQVITELCVSHVRNLSSTISSH